jgi:hypothetical protein
VTRVKLTRQIKFEFTPENLKEAQKIIDRYPPQYKKAACMPILDLGQRQNGGWTSISVMNAVAKLLEMPKMRVYEVSQVLGRIERGETELEGEGKSGSELRMEGESGPRKDRSEGDANIVLADSTQYTHSILSPS